MPIVTSSRNGYLRVPAGATIHTIPEPGHAVGETSRFKRLFTSWSTSDYPMFVRDQLDVSDIHQGSIGNCWFLAGAAAIINDDFGTPLIKSCVVDCGDGWVIVRLFDGNCRPVYLRTKKTRPTYVGVKYGVHGIRKTGFWCAALEKAAACLTKASKRCQLDLENPTMANTLLGEASEAFRMLLGCEVSTESIQDLREGGSAAAESQWNILLSNWSVEVPRGGLEALRAVFGDAVSVTEWKTHRPRVRAAVSAARPLGDPTKIAPPGVPDKIVGPVIRFIQDNGLWSKSSYSGSGVYSRKAEDMFRTITAKRTADCPLGFLTRADVGPRERRGHSSGETMSRGMVGGHVYAILDTFEENVMARRKYIKACNPWGKYGRTYRDADEGAHPKLSAVEQKCGVFWLELNDFTTIATYLYLGTPINIDALVRCM